MVNSRIHWNQVIETLPREKLRELQLKKFKRIMEWAYGNSPFYRSLYQAAGIEPGDIRTLDDIRRVPKIDKGMLRDVQSRDPFPYGDILAVPLSEVTEFRQTSGTTGTPVYQADTWQDWELVGRVLGDPVRPGRQGNGPAFFLPFGYNIFVAFWAALWRGKKVGCEVVPGGFRYGGENNEDEGIEMHGLRSDPDLRPRHGRYGTQDRDRSERDRDPKDHLRRRTGASIPTTKQRIEDAWGAKVYDHIGATEIGAWSYSCVFQRGLHVNEAFFLVEIEDTETGEIIEEPGRNGKMVITAFDRIGKPCIRFDSKDVIRWADYSCECGRTFRIIDGGVVGRADDITKVKGVLLAPTAIEEVVRSFDELSDEYEVIVTKKGDIDDIALRIEIKPGMEERKESILVRLKDELRVKTNLGYKIEVCPAGSLPRYEVKAKRFKDMRKH